MSELPKIVFFGSDAICLPVLDYLITDGATLCVLRAVISQPDRRQGRGKQLQQNPVAAWATEHSIELLQPEKPDAALVDWLLAEQVAVAFVMAYGHFLPKSLRKAPIHGMVNFHGSILPKYRGASPVETAIAMGELETGVCLMQVVKEMDAGGVADVETVRIEQSDTGPNVRLKVGEAVVPLLQRNLVATLAGTLDFQPQEVDQVTHCRKLNKGDGALDFHLPAQATYDKLRAFTPWPGGYFDHADVRIKVGEASVDLDGTTLLPGTVVEVGNTLSVATKDGVVCFHTLQRPGGRMLPVPDFVRGYPIVVGEVLTSVPSMPLVD